MIKNENRLEGTKEELQNLVEEINVIMGLEGENTINTVLQDIFEDKDHITTELGTYFLSYDKLLRDSNGYQEAVIECINNHLGI